MKQSKATAPFINLSKPLSLHNYLQVIYNLPLHSLEWETRWLNGYILVFWILDRAVRLRALAGVLQCVLCSHCASLYPSVKCRSGLLSYFFSDEETSDKWVPMNLMLGGTFSLIIRNKEGDTKQKTGKNQSDQCCRHRSAKAGYDYLIRGGHEIFETTSENSYYTSTCSSWPKLPSSVGR